MNTRKNTIIALGFILLAVIFRIINIEAGFWYNLSLIGAISLFSGAVIKDKPLAFLIPIASFLLSDIYLTLFTNVQGFYGIAQFINYIAMIAVVLLGSTMKSTKPVKVFGYSIAGSVVFFILSNFGVWFGNLFTQFEPGLTLATTYFRALPFLNSGAEGAFANELFFGSFIGDLIFNTILFGGFALATSKSTYAKAA